MLTVNGNDLLVLAAALFALARANHGGHAAWGYLEAFSEAAMVGAIADWFAVTALFRHPLGIPLWHTAIIPNSKNSIGKSLGNFVENHFITEEGIARRIEQADIAGKAGRFLADPANAERLSAWVAPALERLLQMVDHNQVRRMLGELATRELARIDLSSLAGDCVDALIAEDQPQQLADALLDQFGAYLADPGRQVQVAGMGLDHDRATGSQRRGRIAAQHAKGKREITGREHGNRPQRDQGAHHGRMADGRWPRHGRIVDLGERQAGYGQLGKAPGVVNEQLRRQAIGNEALIKEQYSGIRPAPGYPACPDHTEKATLFKLLDPEAEEMRAGQSGVFLTEHYAMFPAAAVSGWYFAHPQAQYFAVGKVDKDQIESYTARKGQDLAVTERWLAPNLGYDN